MPTVRAPSMGRNRKQRGVTMVESLVALVVLSVGMLGIAGLYISSLKAGRSALVRTQAVALATDLADRIRANRGGLANYATASYGSGGPAIQDCLGKDCTPDVLAQDDLARWRSSIALLMPGNATGSATFTDNADPNPDAYTITVAWRESGDTADSTCILVVEL
jgi:type IV pilus assembly protein PilV